MFRQQMVLSNVIVLVTISRRSFVLGLSGVKVSASFTNVMGVAAYDLVSGLSLSWALVSSRRKVVIGLCAVRIL